MKRVNPIKNSVVSIFVPSYGYFKINQNLFKKILAIVVGLAFYIRVYWFLVESSSIEDLIFIGLHFFFVIDIYFLSKRLVRGEFINPGTMMWNRSIPYYPDLIKSKEFPIVFHAYPSIRISLTESEISYKDSIWGPKKVNIENIEKVITIPPGWLQVAFSVAQVAVGFLSEDSVEEEYNNWILGKKVTYLALQLKEKDRKGRPAIFPGKIGFRLKQGNSVGGFSSRDVGFFVQAMSEMGIVVDTKEDTAQSRAESTYHPVR